jgi:hypothetical protein
MIAATGLLGMVLFAHPKPSPTRTPSLPQEVERAIADFEARYPPVELNAKALELEGLAADVGIDLAPPLPNRRHPSGSGRESAEKLEDLRFISDQIEMEDDAIGMPSAKLQAFLVAKAETLQRITDLLSSGESPRWELDVRRGAGAPSPGSIGQIRLQRLLIARALIDVREARMEEAVRLLEASWRLNQSLVGRPELVSQMLAIAVARLQAGALRKGPFPVDPWVDRLRFGELRSSLMTSIADDAVFAAISVRHDLKRSPDFAAFLAGMRGLRDSFANLDPCSFSEKEAGEFWKPLFQGSVSGTLAEIAVPNLSSTVFRLFRLLVESELTARVLEARTLRLPDGTRPSQTPAPESRVCPASSWTYSVGGDGSLTISFAGRFADWPYSPPLKLPLSYRLSASP